MSFQLNKQNINKQGRPKGSKNKKNEFTQNIITEILELGQEKFISELNQLSGKNYVTTYLSLLEYQLPKLARKNIEDESINKIMELPHIIIR